jgi:hypothetical protein
MSQGKTSKRLESDIAKLNNIINSLVEENYMLKSLLSQTQNSTPPNQQNTKQTK